MRSAPLAVVIAAVAVLSTAGAHQAAAQDVCTQQGAPGYDSHDCKVQRLRARSFAVIAVVDSGINPYHVDFRLDPDEDMVGVHPSEFIDGYPAHAVRMQPAFDAGSVAEARQRDAGEWAQSATGALTWVDGTSIIGGMSVHEGQDFFDVGGHGTGVASQAGGRVLGPGHPDVLLVAVRDTDAGVEWAAQQPWIDAITMSWSTFFPGQMAASTWSAADQGKIICAATGNLTVPLWALEQQGPPWHVHVGAVRASDRREPEYSGFPADVLGITHVPAADHTSMTGSREFGGTSGATPAVCGLMVHAVAQARARLGDTAEGPRGDGVLVRGTAAAGPSADGVLTRREVEDAVMATAVPSTSLPPAHFVRGGYGIVDGESVDVALEVLLGERSRPERPTEDRWVGATDAARGAVWGAPPG